MNLVENAYKIDSTFQKPNFLSLKGQMSSSQQEPSPNEPKLSSHILPTSAQVAKVPRQPSTFLFRQSNAKAKESQPEETQDMMTSETKLTLVLPESVNAVSEDVIDKQRDISAALNKSSDNFNNSANGDHSNQSDRSGRKLTTLLREDISSNEVEEEEKSLEEEKRAVIEACRFSPSSLCQLVRETSSNSIWL